jgi:hypothetical protein
MENTSGMLENSEAFVSIGDTCSSYTEKLSNMANEATKGRVPFEQL